MVSDSVESSTSDSETIVFQNINAFNKIYSNYLRCNGSTGNANVKYINTTDCSGTVKLSDVDDAYNNLNSSIIALHANIAKDAASGSKLITPAQFDASYNAMLVNYRNMKAIQSDLDNKMAELEKSPTSNYNSSNNMLNSAIYSNILFTVLATSLLYFTFFKMK